MHFSLSAKKKKIQGSCLSPACMLSLVVFLPIFKFVLMLSELIFSLSHPRGTVLSEALLREL